MPSFFMSSRSSTSTSNSYCLPRDSAVSARWVGVHRLPGRLPRSFASAMPVATAWPCSTAVSSSAVSSLVTSSTSFFAPRCFLSFLSLSDLRASKR